MIKIQITGKTHDAHQLLIYLQGYYHVTGMKLSNYIEDTRIELILFYSNDTLAIDDLSECFNRLSDIYPNAVGYVLRLNIGELSVSYQSAKAQITI